MPVVAVDQPRGEQRRADRDRQVDEEDPVPVDRVGQHAAGEQADRAAGRGDEAVDPDRLRLLLRLREHRHDHPEDHGRGQRAADALREAGADQHRLALGEPAQQRGDREDGQADHEDPPAPDEVAEPTGEQEQAAEADQIGVDDPGEARLREAEIALDRRQRDVDDRHIEDDHEHSDAQHDERRPAAAVGVGRRVSDVLRRSRSVSRGRIWPVDRRIRRKLIGRIRAEPDFMTCGRGSTVRGVGRTPVGSGPSQGRTMSGCRC